MNDDIITITGSGCSDSTILGASGSVDTITLNSYTGSYNMNMASYTAAGIGGATGSSSTYTINTGAGANGTYLTTGGGGTTSWSAANIPAFTSATASISVDGNADFKGDVTVKGKSLNDWMETMEKRLAILVPDPKKLEKFEALQKAYNHYKMLEALCEIEEDDKD